MRIKHTLGQRCVTYDPTLEAKAREMIAQGPARFNIETPLQSQTKQSQRTHHSFILEDPRGALAAGQVYAVIQVSVRAVFCLAA